MSPALAGGFFATSNTWEGCIAFWLIVTNPRELLTPTKSCSIETPTQSQERSPQAASHLLTCRAPGGPSLPAAEEKGQSQAPEKAHRSWDSSHHCQQLCPLLSLLPFPASSTCGGWAGHLPRCDWLVSRMQPGDLKCTAESWQVACQDWQGANPPAPLAHWLLLPKVWRYGILSTVIFTPWFLQPGKPWQKVFHTCSPFPQAFPSPLPCAWDFDF